jgi:hypothetical protein
VPGNAVSDAGGMIERDLAGQRAVGGRRSSSAATEWSGWLPSGPASRGPLSASKGDGAEPLWPPTSPNPMFITIESLPA